MDGEGGVSKMTAFRQWSGQLLDLLFKPSFGASLQHLKVSRRRRNRHSADTPSPSLLKSLPAAERGVQRNDSLAGGCRNKVEIGGDAQISCGAEPSPMRAPPNR